MWENCEFCLDDGLLEVHGERRNEHGKWMACFCEEGERVERGLKAERQPVQRYSFWGAWRTLSEDSSWVDVLLWQAANLPARYAEARLEKLHPSLAKAGARAAALVEKGESLLLAGGPGTGKTYLSAALVFRFAHNPSLYLSVPALLRAARYDRPLLEKYLRFAFYVLESYGLLILDDFGNSALPDWGQELLFDIVDCWYGAQSAPDVREEWPQLIVTTNARKEDFLARLGERIGSRILENCRPLVLSGPSLRAVQSNAPSAPAPEPLEEVTG
ncbi:hypothetical protein HRbin29_00646 [bacterium HR29]|nr:hypothetical protein HRbin29_00646 [bacterium HR29]